MVSPEFRGRGLRLPTEQNPARLLCHLAGVLFTVLIRSIGRGTDNRMRRVVGFWVEGYGVPK
jgi:hypothetical protein